MNIDFDAFTYITGIAGLLGLMLQKDSFPEHREARKTTVLIVIGIFIGSVITSLKGEMFTDRARQADEHTATSTPLIYEACHAHAEFANGSCCVALAGSCDGWLG